MAYENIHVRTTFSTLSPIIDPPSFGLNYLHVGASPTLASVVSLLASIVTATTTVPAGASLDASTWLHPVVNRTTNATVSTAYDITTHLTTGHLGAPVASQAWTVNAGGLGLAPPEGVCCNITLQAPYGADEEFIGGTRPRARDRGRIYFGPMAVNSVDQETTTKRTKLATSLMTDLTKWVHSLAAFPNATTPTWLLCVWSRRDGVLKPLVQCWADDRPDYQRRRADQATNRISQALP